MRKRAGVEECDNSTTARDGMYTRHLEAQDTPAIQNLSIRVFLGTEIMTALQRETAVSSEHGERDDLTRLKLSGMLGHRTKSIG